MSSNDNNAAIHTAASVRRTRRGVTPPVSTATGAETPLNNPNCPSTTASKKLTIHASIDPIFDLPKFILSAVTIYWICDVTYLYVDTLQINITNLLFLISL